MSISPLEISPSPKGATGLLPLCVDLDGTLCKTDTLLERVMVALRENPLILWQAVMQLPSRSAFKWVLSEGTELDVQHLPYHEGVLALLRHARAVGRETVLVTASPEPTALAVAEHLGLFDHVLASTRIHNLKGAAKAEVLCQRYGEGGFCYAGNDAVDLEVWKHAGAAVLVGAAAASELRPSCTIEAAFPDQASSSAALLKAMRPYQWVKNILIFIPLLAAGLVTSSAHLVLALGAFVAFSLMASAVYLANDLIDLDADRRHPRKRRRPFASGSAALLSGMALIPVLISGSILLGVFIGAGFLLALLAYAVLTTAYSLWLKRRPLVDVFALAGLYTSRVVAGGFAIHAPVSNWLLSFSAFTFLSLACIKRHTELSDSVAAKTSKRGYRPGDLPVLMSMGIAGVYAGAVVLALYVDSAAAGSQYPRPDALWGAVPVYLFWQCRMWLAAGRHQLTDDPIIFAARDWVSRWLAVVLCLCAFAAGLPL